MGRKGGSLLSVLNWEVCFCSHHTPLSVSFCMKYMFASSRIGNALFVGDNYHRALFYCGFRTERSVINKCAGVMAVYVKTSAGVRGV